MLGYFLQCALEKEENSLEMSLNRVISAFGINLTLYKVQPGECLLLFLGLGEAEVGFLRARQAGGNLGKL